MPSESKAQQKFFGVQLARKRAGKRTSVDMTEEQIREFAATPRKGLPEHVKPKAKKATATMKATKKKRGTAKKRMTR